MLLLVASTTLQHLELESSNHKPPLRAKPFDVVEYAYTLLVGLYVAMLVALYVAA